MPKITKVFGAPGCGKTTRLMAILEEILAKAPANRVAFVSFTKKGTYEGTQRAAEKFGLKESDLPFFRTLHSVAFRSGGFSKYNMASKNDYKAFSTAMGLKMTGYYTEEFYGNDDRYMFAHLLKRNNPKAAEKYLASGEINTSVLADVEHNWLRYKAQMGVMDFTDMIESFVNEGEALPVDYAIIDEAQDLNTLQWQMCDVAFANCKEIFIAGDDDQAIYEWSGADVQHFLDIPCDEQEILGKSWRLPTAILMRAKSVSNLIQHRVSKDFLPVADGGTVQVHAELDEISVDPSQSWYFLSRNNCFLPVYAEYLRKRALAFYVKDELSYNPNEIAAIRALETGRKRGKLNDLEEVRIKAVMKDPVNMAVPWYQNFPFPNDTTAYYKDLFRFKTNLSFASNILVSTIHGVKGGEADNVVIMMDFTKAVKANIERNPDSELRCLYVAMTRARKNLHLVHSGSKNGYDNYIHLA